jgi:D-threo-aldose 1-dehydrogenase
VLLPACEQYGVAVVIGGALNSGVLADPSPGARFDYAEASADVIARARRMASVCAAHGVPLAAAALQFPLGHPAVAAVLTGVRSVAELETNVAAFDLDLSTDLWEDLVATGAIVDSAPLPSGGLA